MTVSQTRGGPERSKGRGEHGNNGTWDDSCIEVAEEAILESAPRVARGSNLKRRSDAVLGFKMRPSSRRRRGAGAVRGRRWGWVAGGSAGLGGRGWEGGGGGGRAVRDGRIAFVARRAVARSEHLLSHHMGSSSCMDDCEWCGSTNFITLCSS